MISGIKDKKRRVVLINDDTHESQHSPASQSHSHTLAAHWASQAALGSILAVLLTQTVILALRPELAAFKPLDNYARSALFTFVPAMGATAVFAWLAKTQDRPQTKFLWIAAGFLLLSFIPDYVLPVLYRTFQASTAAAFMHLVAGIVTVTLILVGYNRSISDSNSK